MGHGRAETVGCWKLVCAGNSIGKQLVGLFLLALAAGLFNGCASVTANPKQQAQPPTQVSFQLSATSVNFGNVTVGKAATQTVSVTNSGTVALHITQVAVSNAQFTVSGITTPAALGVGQSTPAADGAD